MIGHDHPGPKLGVPSSAPRWSDSITIFAISGWRRNIGPCRVVSRHRSIQTNACGIELARRRIVSSGQAAV